MHWKSSFNTRNFVSLYLSFQDTEAVRETLLGWLLHLEQPIQLTGILIFKKDRFIEYDKELLQKGIKTLSHDPPLSISLNNSESEDGSTATQFISIYKRRDRDVVNITMKFQHPSATFNFSFLSPMLQQTHFIQGYCVDYDYDLLVNSQDLWKYSHQGNLKIGYDPGGSERVIIEGRPGLRAIHQRLGYVYHAGAHHWFGPQIQKDIFPKELIHSFAHAQRIETLPNGVIHVILYEDIFNPFSDENQEKQRLFREHLRINEVMENRIIYKNLKPKRWHYRLFK